MRRAGIAASPTAASRTRRARRCPAPASRTGARRPRRDVARTPPWRRRRCAPGPAGWRGPSTATCHDARRCGAGGAGRGRAASVPRCPPCGLRAGAGIEVEDAGREIVEVGGHLLQQVGQVIDQLLDHEKEHPGAGAAVAAFLVHPFAHRREGPHVVVAYRHEMVLVQEETERFQAEIGPVEGHHGRRQGDPIPAAAEAARQLDFAQRGPRGHPDTVFSSTRRASSAVGSTKSIQTA